MDRYQGKADVDRRDEEIEVLSQDRFTAGDSKEGSPESAVRVALERSEADKIFEAVSGGESNVQNIYPLSPLQEGMLFHYLLNPTRDTYVLSILFECKSEPHVRALIFAIQKVIDRHESLRGAVLWEHLQRPVQVIHRSAVLAVEEVYLAPDRNVRDQLKEWTRPERQPIDLVHAPLLRFLIAVEPDGARHYAILRLHHLICDYQALRNLVWEAVRYLEGHESELALPESLKDYLDKTLPDESKEESAAFFRSKLGDVSESTAPFGIVHDHKNSDHLQQATREIGADLVKRLRAQARRFKISAARVFHAAVGLVVAQTSGRSDVVFGTVLSSRRQRNGGERSRIWMSANTLPLRLQLEGASAAELIAQTEQALVELLRHRQFPLAAAQRCSAVAGQGSLFSTLLIYRHGGADLGSEWASTDGIRVLEMGEAGTNYPITLIVDDLGQEIRLTAQTYRHIDPARMAEYLRAAVKALVGALEDTPQKPALQLSILPEDELRQIIHKFNATRSAFPSEKLLHELFEEQAGRTPDAVALSYDGALVTYAELSRKSNQLARYLRAKRIGPDELVGICMERCPELVLGLLGILKAGGAYVPLDPSYPRERLTATIAAARPRVVLSKISSRAVIGSSDVLILCLDENHEAIDEEDNVSLQNGCSPTSHYLAYVIYTSGSTGIPKGVMVEHRSVVNCLNSFTPTTEFGASDRLLAVTTLSFDIAALEIFMPLLSGGQLMIAPRGATANAQNLSALIGVLNTTILQATPSSWRMLIDAGWSGGSSLRVLCGGEPLPSDLSKELAIRVGRYWNVYGPTETTIWSSCQELARRSHSDSPAIEPIGRPIANTEIYLLDGQLQPVPIGTPGEIHIGGVGLARGYWDRPELTAERFVADPFGAASGARLYKTGDLGRWQVDGSIEYLGRSDQQVKLRGFRIELEEIESHLVRHSQVKEAIVAVREDVPGDKRLVAYVVPTLTIDEYPGSRAEELRAHLLKAVPAYMIPSAFVMMDRLPLTPNGKRDRRALPAPNSGAYATRQDEPPQGLIEEALASIWEEVLRIERVGRWANFFELGGHSLLGVKLIHKVAESLSIRPSVASIFDYPTLGRMAEYIRDVMSEGPELNGSESMELEGGIVQ